MKKLILLLFFISFQLFSQNFDQYQLIVNNNESIDKKIISIDSLLQPKLQTKKNVNYFKIGDAYISWLYRNKKLEKSLSTLLILIDQTPSSDTKNLEKRLYQASSIYRLFGVYSESTNMLNEILKTKNYNGYYLKALQRIADNYYEIGDYQSSKKYYDIAEIEFKNVEDFDNLITNNIFSYNAYSKISGDAARLEIERKLLFVDSLSKIHKPSTKNVYRLNITLANIYSTYENRNIEKGLPFVLKAIDIAKKLSDSNLISRSYVRYGIILDTEYPKQSILKFKEALNYCPKDEKALKTVIYANLGLNKVKLNNFKEAIKDQHTALEIALGNNLKSLNEADALTLLSEENSTFNLRIILSNLAETYYLVYKKNQNVSDLTKSIQFFKYSDKVIDNYFKSDVSVQSKLLWREEASEIYSRAIRSCFAAGDLESAFLFMEKSKALLLYEEIANLKKLQSLDIPDSILQKERYYRATINRLEKIQSKQKDSLQKAVAFQDSLSNLTKEITQNYPNYKVINDLSFTTIADAQQQLAHNEAILSYHISADNGFGLAPNTETGYGILITTEDKILFEINNLSDLKNQTEHILDQLRTKQRTATEVADFEQTSRTLYNKLIPEHIQTHLKDKEITIIPDGYLNKLPFEALVTSDTNTLTYLIEDHEIHYLFSISFNKLTDDQKEETSVRENAIAFAPIDFNDMSSLVNAKREVEMINNHIVSTTFLKNDASTTNFINSLDQSRILHLATHANSDNNDPWIQFSDEKIHLDKLSTLSNNTSLVVLSACETTTGEMAAGEGILSLARGFFYGGTQATLSSLWKVDDKATYQLMDSFYEHLSEGKTKSSALREAKLTYLATHSGSERSPYYWSSFILTGAIDPVPLSNNNWIYYVLCSIIIIGIIGVTLSRKRNKN